MKNKTLYLILFFSIAFSCSKKIDPNPQKGIEYIPLTVGNYWIYDVTSIRYEPYYTYTDTSFTPQSGYADTLKFQLKEELFEKDVDLNGNDFFVIYRYKRFDSLSEWAFDSAWYCQIESNNFIRTENNIKFIKLTFPVEIDRSWNSNAQNTIFSNECPTASYSDFIDYNNFGTVAEVTYCNNTSSEIVSWDLHYDYYAPNIGLTKSFREYYQYCNVSSIDDTTSQDTTTTNYPCSTQPIIDNGYKYTQELIDYFIQ